MKIKDDSELARVMGRALASYANRVENGEVTPFLKFLGGAATVTVGVRLNDDGSINVKDVVAISETTQPINVDVAAVPAPAKTVPVRKRSSK